VKVSFTTVIDKWVPEPALSRCSCMGPMAFG